jgi:hypothetical protein
MNAKKFHQQKLTVAHSIERKSRWKYIIYDLTDVKFFYKISDRRIMMVVRYGSGKNRSKFECVYYNGIMKDDSFVIRDVEPIDVPVWLENQYLFDEFIAKNGLASAEFSTFRTSKSLPLYHIDDAIPMLWEDFKEFQKGPKKAGNWVVEFTNVSNGEKFTTKESIRKGYTWKDYFKLLIESIEEMNAGKLSNVKITNVYYYEGKDNISFAG